jgi:hypothetical protein
MGKTHIYFFENMDAARDWYYAQGWAMLAMVRTEDRHEIEMGKGDVRMLLTKYHGWYSVGAFIQR